MKRLRFSLILLGFLTTLGISVFHPVKATAFNGNNLIDDFVFNNSSAMSSDQIDSFLNSKPSSCISPNSGFQAKIPNGYSPSNGFSYGGFGSAGQVIATAAQVYGINPQVLITTLEKEQSLVTGRNNFGGYCNNGDEHKYAAATGYGCPDGGTTYSYSGISLYRRGGVDHTNVSPTCVNGSAKAGFSQQVIRAAWLLKFGQQRSMGNTSWAVINGSWDNSDDPPTCYGGPMTQGNRKRCSSDSSTTYYDGYVTIDGSATHMDSGATAALYWYTPHFHGNQNFDDLFTGWFGSIYANYGWYTTGFKMLDVTGSYYVDPGYLEPGGRYLVDVAATNTGNVTWTNDGPTPVRLGTGNWAGHGSGFCDSTWLWCGRPVNLRESSVAPGQDGHFDFIVQVPFKPGNYRDWFQPVAENLRWFPDINASLGIRVIDPGSYTWTTTGFKVLDSTESTYIDPGQLQPNTRYIVKLQAINTGSAAWTNTGLRPVRLGTNNPAGKDSFICDSGTWLWCGRPVNLQESTISPGQIGNFRFFITTPSTPGPYREYFRPVAEYYTWFNDANASLGFIVR